MMQTTTAIISSSSIALLSFLSHFIILTAQQDFIYHRCYNGAGNYTNTSAYQSNLNLLLSNLTSNNKIDYGYYTSSQGQNPNRVNALGLCRADIKPDSCRSFLNNATSLLRRLCPNQKEAYGYNDGCILRYANRSMFGINQDPDFSIFMCNPNNATDIKYSEALDSLMRRLRSKAAAGSTRWKFAANTTTTLFQNIYGLVQCMPDLSEQDCDDCLEKSISSIPYYCNNRIGGRIIKMSCNIRYENYRFYDTEVVDSLSSPPPASPPSNTSSTQGTIDSPKGNSNISRTVTIVVVPLGVFIALLILICIYFAVRKSKRTVENSNERAQLNWVIRYKIIGGIASGLLYLHEDSRLRVIHRDLKLSNILLDEELNPKISDFGMAKLFVVDQTQSNTSRIVGTYGYMVPKYVMHGQYSVKSDVFSFGILVLKLISGRKNNSIFDEENSHDVLSFAWKNWREGTVMNIVDPVLNNGSRNEVMRCIHIGLLCVQENVADRPNIASVVLMLNSFSLSLPLPLRPPLLTNSTGSSEVHFNEYSLEATRSSEPGSNTIRGSINEASITELYPR